MDDTVTPLIPPTRNEDPLSKHTLITRDGQQVDAQAFTRFLDEYPKGILPLELAEALAECIAATQLYDKASSFTLTVQVAPTNSMLGELLVKAKVDSKPARATVPEVSFFPTPEGGLSRRDPNQSQLPGTEHA